MMDDLQEYLNWYKDNNIYKSNYVLFGTFLKHLVKVLLIDGLLVHLKA